MSFSTPAAPHVKHVKDMILALLEFMDKQSATPERRQAVEFWKSIVTDETGLVKFNPGEFEAIEKARVLLEMTTRPDFYRHAILLRVQDLAAPGARIEKGAEG